MVSYKTGAGVLAILVAGLAGFLLGKIPSADRPDSGLPASQSPALTSARPPALPQQPSNPPVEPAAPAQPQPLRAAVSKAHDTGQSTPMVALTENRLSVHAQDHSLKDILEQIAALSAVPIVISESIKDHLVSGHFDDVSLEDGLRRLLYRLDAFFFYAVEGIEPAALQAVWVYPQGHGKRILPMPPDAWASMAEMRQYLRDPDPDMRARAAETLVERQGKRALEAVLEALEDRDEKVRYRTLAKAVQAGVPLRGDMLQSLLRTDSSPVVRFLAFEALAKAPDVSPQMLRESATWALNDAHESIREEAQNLLEELDLAGAPLEASDPIQEQLQGHGKSGQ